MKRFGRVRGFTLIELLVVIAVITILVSMIVALVVNVQRNAQIKRTTGTIQVLVLALSSYHADFRLYPPIDNETISGAVLRNETLFDYLTKKSKQGTKSFGPYVDDDTANAARDTDSNDKMEFVDAWNNALIINMPGEDHSGDKDADGKRVAGPNNMALVETVGPPIVWDQSTMKFDIYSYGPNLVDDSLATKPVWLTRDRGADGTWGYYKTGETGDPPDHDHGDDVTSWNDLTKKTN